MGEIMYYSYLWLREDRTPYYAGKGKGNRAFTSKDHGVHCPKEKERIVIYSAESEADAFETEIALIWYYGRKDLGTGCLRNLTNGGDAPPKMFGNAFAKGNIAWNKGRVGFRLSEEHCKNIGVGLLKHSDAQILEAYNSSESYVEGSKLLGMKPSPFRKRCKALGLIAKRRKYTMKTPICHPTEKHYGNDLCHACYMTQYRVQHHEHLNSLRKEWRKTRSG